MSFGDLPIGARFHFHADLAWCTLFRERAEAYTKMAERRYRRVGADGQPWDMRVGFLGQAVSPIKEDTDQ
jgi:hypothetical protein